MSGRLRQKRSRGCHRDSFRHLRREPRVPALVASTRETTVSGTLETRFVRHPIARATGFW